MHALLVRCTQVTFVFALAVTLSVGGCLDRPAVPGEPTTKTNITLQVAEQTVDKVDILFDIDNSASMGDKQAYLSQAIPDLITRLVTPNCVERHGQHHDSRARPTLDGGTCPPAGSTAEFPPVHDMHIGIVSSSLGARLGDACPTTGPSSTQALAGGGTLDRPQRRPGAPPRPRRRSHDADELHRGPARRRRTSAIPRLVPAGDRERRPTPAATPTGPTPMVDPTQLEGDFPQLVVGRARVRVRHRVAARELVPLPHPARPVRDLAGEGHRQREHRRLEAVGGRRHDHPRAARRLPAPRFARRHHRPDRRERLRGRRALVRGTGYNFMATTFSPPRGTSQACATNPADPNCTSCCVPPSHGGATRRAPRARTRRRPTGATTSISGTCTEAKYGASVQFPISAT